MGPFRTIKIRLNIDINEEIFVSFELSKAFVLIHYISLGCWSRGGNTVSTGGDIAPKF